MMSKDNNVEESSLNEETTAPQPSASGGGDHNEGTAVAVSGENKKAVEDEAHHSHASDDNVPRPWLHAAYHSIVSFLDVYLPYSFAYLGWVGGWAKLDDLRMGPFNYGKLIANVLHFFIVAFVLFLVVKAMNKAKTIIVQDDEETPPTA